MRPATPADAAAIATINVRGWQASFRGIFPDEFLDAMEPGDRLPRVEEIVRRGAPHHGAVAMERDEVLGFVLMGPPKTEDLDASRIHEIYSLYVEPSGIGTGIGRALMAHALEYLRSGEWEGAVL